MPERLSLIAIEITSPDYRLADVMDDPRHKHMYLFQDGLREVQRYAIPELGLETTGADLFD